MSFEEWRERLRAEPRATVAELLRGFAGRRSPRPQVEDFFWRVLVDRGTPEEVVHAVLGRLREPVESEGLLDLDREHRVRVRGRLRVVATELLAGFVHDPTAREAIAADPVRLPEAVFAHRRRWAEAAALFALEHDHLLVRRRLTGRLAQASLRYALARALHRVEGRREQALRVMEGALALTERTSVDAPDSDTWRSFADRLAFHAREWLGLRHYEAARYTDAVREFRAAGEAAPETDLAVAARTFAANALIRDGRHTEARELLDGLERASAVPEDDVSDAWEELRRRLMDHPGENGPDGSDGGDGPDAGAEGEGR